MAVIISFPSRPKAEPVAAPVCIGNTVPKPSRSGRKKQSSEENVKAMRRKIQVAKQQLMAKLEGFDDATYRQILQSSFGVKSSTELTTERQLHALLMTFAALGFESSPPKEGSARQTRLDKIESLLKAKGAAEGTAPPFGYAVAILKNQTANHPDGQVTSLRNASSEQLDAVIAALHRDGRRKGWR